MSNPTLGKLELDALRFVAENAPITVREVAARFGEPRHLARTTILTVMERLRKKGYLCRAESEAGFQYSPGVSQLEVTQGLIQEFIDKTLAGSISPFLAYLVDKNNLSQSELIELRKLVEGMEDRSK